MLLLIELMRPTVACILRHRRLMVPLYHRRKAPLDRALAALMLIPGLPLIGVLMLLVRLTSRGPAIYRQQRVGRDGIVFTMYKLRSMTTDAETGTGAVWASQQDPRVTPVGAILRRLHLDELPQLFNVLKGEMSLIGPRPERPEFVEKLSDQVPGYLDRLSVRPGVTGLAQINLPPDSNLDDVRRKLVLDLEYVGSARLRADAQMLLCTLLRLSGIPGALATRVTCVQRSVQLPATPTPVQAGQPSGRLDPAHDDPFAKADERPIAEPREDRKLPHSVSYS